MTLHELVLRDVGLVSHPCPHVGQRVLQGFPLGLPDVLARRRVLGPRLRHRHRYRAYVRRYSVAAFSRSLGVHIDLIVPRFRIW